MYELTYIAIPYGAVGRFEREALMVWKEPHMKGDSRAGNQQMDLHNIVQTVLEFHKDDKTFSFLVYLNQF